MSIQKTTHYNLDKPSKGSLNWHENLNQNFDKIDTELKTVDTVLVNHIASTTAHAAQNITYAGEIAGQAEVKGALDNLQSQVDVIVVGGTEVDPRVSQALVDSESTTHDTLKARNNSWEARTITDELALGAHKASSMPHLMTDHKTGKTYKYGERISPEGKPQLIFEEVI